MQNPFSHKEGRRQESRAAAPRAERHRSQSAWQSRGKASDKARARRARDAREHKPSRLATLVNHWWDRLLTSVTHREFGSAVELYSSGRTPACSRWPTSPA